MTQSNLHEKIGMAVLNDAEAFFGKQVVGVVTLGDDDNLEFMVPWTVDAELTRRVVSTLAIAFQDASKSL